MKESFLVYKSFYEPIKSLSNEDLGMLLRAIFEYQINEIEPTNTSRIFMAFQFFKNQFRLDEEKYQKVINRNRTNGLKGGRNKTKSNPKNPVGFHEPKKADNDNDKDNVLSKDNNIKPKKVLFKNSELFDKHKFAAKFSDWNKLKQKYYYDSAVSYSTEGNKYVNWELAIRNWAKRDELNGKLKFDEKSELTLDEIRKQKELDFLSRV